MGFLSFTAWQFALAGALCAAGPVVIHLLNRRRYRVVEWAAMDFLREAMQRNRRILHLRDVLLLLLRTAAVLLFGLALAQPFFAAREEEYSDRQPLHAVIVVDNSLSMGYEALDGNLLAKAKDRARQLIDKLPGGSKISILPACGGRDVALDPYETKENALEALDKIEVVDRSASLLRAVNEAKRAREAVPELAGRIVFIGDQQQLNWGDLRSNEIAQDLPPMQVVDVAPAEWENTWISDLRLQDGLADVETPATVVVEIEHRGPSARRDLQVTLSMGETVLGEKTVTVEPGLGARQVDFEVVFNTLAELPEPDRPLFVPLRASLAPDRLAADDERHLAVPVVASLPVVFVDQFGAEGEDPIRGRIGETRPLRKLLAPRTSRRDAPRQLIQVRHITPDQLSQEILADARLVVIAGVHDPGENADVLRQYVEQGGQLLIAAGGNFDPVAWNEAAWDDGAGILPLPLGAEPIGEVPEVAGANVRAIQLSFESLAGEDVFQLAGIAEAELRDLYAEPFFFKAVAIEADQPTLDRLRAAEEERLADELSIGDQPLPDEPAARRRHLQTLALQRSPQVLARFENADRSPYLVSRQIGRGQVYFAASGLASSWSTLANTNAVVAFDRILRGMIGATLPRRNFAALERLTLPLPSEDPQLTVLLARPGESIADEPLDVGYLGTSAGSAAAAGAVQRGVTVTNLLARGVYRIVGRQAAVSTDPLAAADKPLWEVPLVVAGSAGESDLTPLARDEFDRLAAAANLRWIGLADEISLAGVAIRGQTSWWWLALAVLVLLLVEMIVLAWPALRRRETLLAP
ncbi:MAG: BatA domain-containing protein [Pirellulaceae bacterium]